MPCAAPGCHPGPAPPVFPGCSIGPVVIAPDAEDPDKKILYWYPALSNEHRIEIWVLLTPRARKWISSRLKAEYDLFWCRVAAVLAERECRRWHSSGRAACGSVADPGNAADDF